MADSLFSAKIPAVPTRGIHLDFKGMVPTFSRLMELLSLFKRLHYQIVLVEWEDCFPWTCDERLRAPHALTPSQVQRFSERCEELGLEIVPLVQSLGHSENVLRLQGNEVLREVPERTDVFHPLHPRSSELVAEMVADVLRLLPGVKRFHLGGDEVYTLGKNPASEAFVQENGVRSLYLRQLEPSFQLLEARGIRPILWHDEIVGWSEEDIQKIAARADLIVWGYSGDPRDSETYHFREPHVEKLSRAGCVIWGAGAYKGADGPNANRPNLEKRTSAAMGWVDLVSRFRLEGIFVTGWSRYASGRMQVDPIEGALDSLVSVSSILFDGKSPSGEKCLGFLDQFGEGITFRKVREVLGRLTELTDRLWEWTRQMEEQLATLDLEPHREKSGIEQTILDLLEEDLQSVRRAGIDLEEALGDQVELSLLKNYVETRIMPLEGVKKRLEARLALGSWADLVAS